ncbi:MAG TPA: hypothetical protein VFA79_16080 [Myxococcales bacterium]|nr:hypothetical protein [Myxococcales bacterium]
MQPQPHLESCLRLAFEARDPQHVSGVSLSSWFVRAPTRGRRRAGLDGALLFPDELRARLGPEAAQAIALAMDAATWRTSPAPRPAVPLATREWLAEAALAIGQAEGFPLTWAMLRAISELESTAERMLGARAPRSTVRQVLHGVGQRTLRVEPFASFVVRVLKIAQAAYAAFRHAGHPHGAAWQGVQDRLWLPYPTGRSTRSGAEVRGAYLPSLLQAAAGNARKRLRRSADEHRTQDHARTLLARFASGPGLRLWPWADAEDRLLPQGGDALSPEMAGVCFFALLAQAADERRRGGGPSGGLSASLAEAGFASPEWLPDRTDDLAIRLLTAAAPAGVPEGDLLDAVTSLVRATLSSRDATPVARALEKVGIEMPDEDAEAVLARARGRLPDLARWLEENGRELLERA